MAEPTTATGVGIVAVSVALLGPMAGVVATNTPEAHMTDYIQLFIAAAGALIAGILYGRRWGHADGHAEGYEAGRTKGLLEGAGVVSPSLAGGPGAVPR